MANVIDLYGRQTEKRSTTRKRTAGSGGAETAGGPLAAAGMT